MMIAGGTMSDAARARSRGSPQQLRIDVAIDAPLEGLPIQGGGTALRERRDDDSRVPVAHVKAAGGQVLLDELTQELLFMGVVGRRRRVDRRGCRIRVHGNDERKRPSRASGGLSLEPPRAAVRMCPQIL